MPDRRVPKTCVLRQIISMSNTGTGVCACNTKHLDDGHDDEDLLLLLYYYYPPGAQGGPLSEEERGTANEAGIRNQLAAENAVRMQIFGGSSSGARKGPRTFSSSPFPLFILTLTSLLCSELYFTLCTDFASCSCVLCTPPPPPQPACEP